MFAMEKHMHQSKNATISLSFANIKLYILLALSSIFLASCGGSSSNDGSGGNSGSTITVGLFKGPTVGASCDITDASGKTINRITGPKGLSIESSSISPGILTVSCSGGTYIDEATNAEVDAPNMRAVAYYPGGDFKIIISPLSEIAYQRAIAVAGNVDSLDESKVNAESEAVATLFGLDGVNTLQTIPTPIVGTNAATAEDNDEGRFAMVLAGLSKMIGDSQGGTSTAQVEAGIDALVKDLAEDGVFDTKDSLIAGINSVVVSNPSIDSEVNATLTTAISDATLDATATLTAVEAPAISVPNNTQYVYVVNTAITNLVYSALESSGGATECSISSLPQGLQLNGTTTLTVAPNRSGQCVISGTPSTVTATANYTLTVSNAIGSESAEISLTVNPEAPNVADASAQTLTKGTPATISFDNTGGTITSCTLDVTSDSLTGTGLSLNSNDCSITGTPNTVTTLNIVVVATNVTATDTANVSITINDEAPALQNIPTKQIFALNVAKTITFNNAGGGTLTECSVSPALPTGLTIAPNSTNTTCEITGSATTETPVATYTITAKNATAQSNADVAIEVVNIIPVNVVPITSSVFENAGSVVAFRIETTPAPSSDLTGTLNFGGNASTGGHASAAKSTFTIAAGTTSTTLSINLTDNEYPNSARVFTAQVSSVSDTTYGPGATGRIDITDNDAPYVVTVSGTNAPLTEADNAILTFTISTNRAVATNDAVTVDLSYGDSSTTADVSGTSDFSNIPTQVVISAGENSATLELPLVNDNTVERTEYVNAAISNATNAHGGSFAIGSSQTATISDNDTYQISIAKIRDGAENNNDSPTSAQFAVTVTPANETGGDITGTLIYDGTADQGTDYTAKNTFSISNGASSDTIELPIRENPNGEGNQTIEVSINTSTISVSGGYDYSVAQDSATASIIDDDITQIIINRVTENITESSATGVELFTVSVLNADSSLMTNNGLGAISGTITFSGDAFTGNDVTTPSATTFNFPLGSITNPQTITFNINQDTTPENTEQITAQITAVVDGVNADSYSVNTNPVSVGVEDDSDNYTITIGSPVNATEGTTNPQFTLTTDPAVASGDTITVNLSYTGSADTTGTSDFSNLPDSATITTGTTGTLILTLATDDGIVELDETVIATIDSATNANGISLNIGTPNNSTATINDNDTHSVSIAKATDGDGTEDSNDNTLEFVISVTPPNTEADITGTLILSGTNIDANDFTGVANTSFPNVPFTITTSDNGSQTITIGIADPDDAEGSETVIATLNNSFTSGGYSTTVASNNSANATITDNDITAVKIRALPTTVAESDTNQTISYEVYLDGSAVGGAINPVSGTITFSGATTQVLDSTAQPFNITSGSAQTIQLTLIGDTTPEAVSTLTATIDPNSITNTAQFQASSPDNSATITITDDDNYTITIGSPVNATEGGTNPQFTLTTDPAVASGDTITVNLSYTGSADTTGTSDFSNLPDSATITTGTTGTLILTLATDDGIVELDETVIATIDSATNANGISLNIGTPNNSTATINDNDTHSVSIAKATDGDGTEDSNDNTLEFVISVTPPNTEADITGTLILSGTNIDANDFTGVANTSFPNVPFTITTSDNGSQTITIGIADPDDAEGLETVIATLNNSFTSGGYSTTLASNNSANATITDNDITAVKIRALPTTVAESDTNQTISYEVYLDGSAVGGAINPVSGTITFSGATTQVLDSTAQPFNITSGSAQTIQLTLIGDTTPEAVSTLTATIDPNSITNTAQFQASSPDNSATITITDDDNYTITIGSPVNATEGGTNPQFTLTTDPAVASGDTITVNLSYTGSADTTGTSDFSNLPDSATITTGTTGTLILTLATDDGIVELDETVIATIDSATNANGISLNIGTPNNSSTVTINDNDTYQISIAKIRDGAENNNDSPTSAQFAVTVTPANETGGDITGTLIYDGTADQGTDYTAKNTFSISNGASSDTIELPIRENPNGEGNQTIEVSINTSTISVSGGYDYSVAQDSATASIIDDDITQIIINRVTENITESSATGVELFTVSVLNADSSLMTNNGLGAISGTITFSGDAFTGNDVTTPSATTFNFPLGSITNPQTITFNINQDTTPENTEQITAQITAVVDGVNADSYSVNTNPVSVGVEDDSDNYTITIGSPVNATEGTTNPQFTLTTDPAVASGDTITVNLSYTGSADTTGTSDFSNLPDSATITTGTTGTLILTLATDDGIVELDETVIATIDSATNANGISLNIGTPNNSTATINDNDTHSVSIAKATDGDGTEDSNDNTLEFVISVTPPNTEADITGTLILSGTNIDANDFTGVANTSFPNVPFTITTSDNGSQTITIGIADPDDAEGLETVIATLNNSFTSGGYSTTVASNNSANATITDNDAYTISIESVANAVVTEGDVNKPTFRVVANHPVLAGDSINVAISYTGSASGSDDISTPTTVTIPAGATSATYTVDVVDDNITESNESFTIALNDSQENTTSNGIAVNRSSTLSAQAITYTINNDDIATVNFDANSSSANEGNSGTSSADVTLSMTNPSSAATTITYTVGGTANNPDDHTLSDGTITIPAGQTVGTITITDIRGDNVVEDDETVIITITRLTGAELGSTLTHTYTITNDDIATVNFDASSSSANEGNSGTSSADVTLSMTNPSSAATTITYTVGGTANNPDDHTLSDGTITIPAGQTVGTITITDIRGDNVVEDDETVIITITRLTGAELGSTLTHTYTITNDDTTTLQFASGLPTSGLESATALTLTVTLTNPAAHTITAGVTANASSSATSDGTDYTLPNSVTINAGDTVGTISITINDDNTVEETETIVVDLSNVSGIAGVSLGSPVQHTYNITNDDTTTVNFDASSSSANEGNSGTSSAAVTLSMTNPSSAATTITYTVGGTANNPDDHTLSDGTITIPAGQTAGTITITDIRGDNVVEDDETVIITITRLTGAELGSTLTHTYTITNDDIATVNFAASSSSANEGNSGTSSADVTLSMTNPSSAATTITYTVDGTANNPDDHTLSGGTITIPAGQTVGTITITDIRGDNVVEDDETVIITITRLTGAELGSTLTHTYTITNDDIATVNFDASSSSANEGNLGTSSADVTLSMTNPSSAATTITYTVDGTANNPDDHTLSDGTITIPAGQTVGTITITDIRGDNVVEYDETVIITITRLTGAELGSTLTHTYTITNDDTHSVAIAKATDGDGTEDSNDNTLEFVISVTPPNTQADITGTLILSGTNIDANDFIGVANTSFPNVPFTIATSDNGSQTITIGIADPDDAEGSETVTATLNNSFTSGGYSVTVAPSPDNSATATITDNDIVNIATITAQVGANSATMQITNPTFFDEYTVYLSNDVDCDTANYSLCTNGQTQSTSANQTTEFTATSLTLDGTPTFGVLQTASTQYGEFSISLDKFNKRQSQVVEMNGDLYVIGGNAADGRKNDVWKSSDNGQNWVELLADNPNPGNNQFTPRSSHRVVVKNDVIYVIGGFDTANTNDVWKSTDGETWEEVLGHTNNPGNDQFTPRRRHEVVVKDDEMYLIGGNGNSARLNDVWKSTDNGETWEEVTENAAFTARQDHQVVVKGSDMYLIGGSATDERKNDVWKSTNGETWTLVISNNNNLTDDSHFSPRWGHQVVVKDDQMYLIGGTDSGGNKNDVWKSNGGTWTLVISHDETPAGTQFSARNTHQVVVLDDDMYLISGIVGTDERTNDVWKSTDGRDWKVVNNSSAEFTPREYHRVVEMDGELYLIGGDDGIRRNDIWKSTDTGKTWTQVETEGTIFSARRKHQVVVKGSDMYVIGGNDGLHKSDVWKSTDKGVTWTELTKNAAFTARGVHQVVVIDNTMYLMGGWLTTQNITNDVWSSTDGQNWTRVTPTSTNSVFSERYAHQVVTLGEDMYLIGGRDKNKRFNDIWKSTDKGKTWAEVTTTGSKFTPRRDHQVLGVGTNTMYVIGGRDDSGRRNDIWKSTDQGVTWTEISEHDANSKTKFAPRQAHQVVAIDGTMFVIGGHTDDGYVNDVWSSTDGENWLFHAKAVVALKKDQPELSNTGTTTATFGDAPLTVSTEGGTGTGTVSASSSNAGVATVSGTQITITGPGTTTITITKAGDDNYYETSDTYTLTVGLKPAYTVSVQSVGNTTVTEGDGNNLQFKVELDRAVETGDSVTAQINYSGTANNDNDTTNRQTSVTIPAGTNTAMVSISVQDDNIAEVAKQLVVTLNTTQQYYSTNKNPITVNTNAQSVIFTINDDEFANTNNTNITGHNAQAYTATVNIAFSQTFTNTGDPATACSIAPVLPTGISINLVNGTCEISGTATENIESLNYTVSASNIRGTSTATISFEVVDAPNITALQPLVQVVQGQNINQPITLTSNSGGPITEYGMVAANGLEVDENIPGLNFDTLTGQLSGNVQFTAAVGIATYTITATGPNGATSQATIQIQVTQGLQAPQISDLTYNATTEIAIPASTVVLPNTGGAIDIWEITGTGVTGPINDLYTIGNGLTFNQRTGEVGGTPAGPAAETNYTVNAGNNSGFNSATLTLTVLSKPVSNVNVPMTITSYPIMSGQTESNIDVRVEVDTNAATNTYEVEYRFKSDNSGNWSLNLRTATPFTGTLPDFATYNNGDTLSYRVTVTNAQNAINIVTKESTVSTSSTYSISDSRVIEGVDGTKTMVFTIVREGNTSTSGSVEFAVDASSSAGSVTTIADLANTYESGTGTVDNDYVGATSGTVTFPASGAQVQTIAFTINGDYWKEFNQKIVVTIGTPTGGTILRSTGIGVINEVDAGAMTGLFALTDLNPEKVTYAIRVRRSSDNVEQDIGFDHNGNLDTTALLAFVGTGANDHGYVSVWYDQSDYDQNLTQVNRDQQGTIVSAGQLVVGSTGEPVISFNEGRNGTYDGFNNDFDYMQMTGNSASVENLVIDFTMQVNTTTSSALANFGQTNQNGDYTNRISIHPMNLAAGSGETTFFDSNKGNIANSDPDATKQTLGELEQVNFALSGDNNANAGTATLNNTDAARVMFINGESVSNQAGGLSDNIVLGPTWYIGAAAATTQNVDLHQPMPVMLSEFSLYESNELQTAANAFTGSSNNDVFTYAGDLENIDGSAGYDVLYINSNTTPTITLDTTANSATSTLGVNSIERIIAAGNGQNDVITITDALVDSTDEDVIEIQMDSTDTLTLPNSFNVGSSATETYNGISYTVYTHNTNTALRVFVSGSPTVSN